MFTDSSNTCGNNVITYVIRGRAYEDDLFKYQYSNLQSFKKLHLVMFEYQYNLCEFKLIGNRQTLSVVLQLWSKNKEDTTLIN